MAALGKIRSKGAFLMGIIGLGLFAFIAEEAFRSCESTRNNARQQVGEVLGEKINVNEFQKLVDEYTEVIKMQQGAEALNDEQLNQVKDMVWNTFVQTKIVEHEAKQLGLRVTDAELQNVLKAGTNPMLLQTPSLISRPAASMQMHCRSSWLNMTHNVRLIRKWLSSMKPSISIGHSLKRHFVSSFWHRNTRACLHIVFCQIL